MCLPSSRHSTIEVNLCHSSNIWAPKGLLVCVCVSPCFSKLSRSLATGYGLRAMGYRLRATGYGLQAMGFISCSYLLLYKPCLGTE